MVTAAMAEKEKQGQWGRAWEVSGFTKLSTSLILLFTPLLVFYFYVACTFYRGSLLETAVAIFQGDFFLENFLPSLSFDAFALYFVWFGLQIALAIFASDFLHRIVRHYKGGQRLGSLTPAGNQLSYNINGLQAWAVSHALFFFGAFYFNWFSPAIIADYWGPLLLVTNISGYALALFAFLKAHYFPTYLEDRKFSGSKIYDFYMGIELNPRIGNLDFKLFFNGRPGIIAWTLINLSFAAKQYQLYGYVTNSMILVNVLQAIYVLDFFWNEAWYLKTIDIGHDHFGWMLAWGDLVWLPYMYSLQAYYLLYHPVDLSTPYAGAVLLLGAAGYYIFRSANRQKDRFRASDGTEKIWGKCTEFLPCRYTCSDGRQHKSKLLLSGWWGIGRHMNYTGDLLGALAYGLACGFDSVIPYFYFFYMVILLVHRCYRDEHRCRNKYGQAWEEYCRRVPYRLLPGVY